ncbi:hypothetical protein FPHYL_1552 [Fusarium phyllophilum]|uniref:Uncharacterized protein n=1 Tax=Fusarium phyllophilum TaxID=47803 RepID=A0A8H5K965_9HYPO|nr:hypothetical protein FPHYL_1552 [Fusarium phyllophilum]
MTEHSILRAPVKEEEAGEPVKEDILSAIRAIMCGLVRELIDARTGQWSTDAGTTRARSDVDFSWNDIDYMWPITADVRAWDDVTRKLHYIYQSESEVCKEDAERGALHKWRGLLRLKRPGLVASAAAAAGVPNRELLDLLLQTYTTALSTGIYTTVLVLPQYPTGE